MQSDLMQTIRLSTQTFVPFTFIHEWTSWTLHYITLHYREGWISGCHLVQCKMKVKITACDLLLLCQVKIFSGYLFEQQCSSSEEVSCELSDAKWLTATCHYKKIETHSTLMTGRGNNTSVATGKETLHFPFFFSPALFVGYRAATSRHMVSVTQHFTCIVICCVGIDSFFLMETVCKQLSVANWNLSRQHFLFCHFLILPSCIYS